MGRVGAMLLIAGTAVLGSTVVGAAPADDFADLPAGAAPSGAPSEPPVVRTDAIPAPRTAYPVPGGARVAAPDGRGEACSLATPCDLPKALSGAAPGATVVLRGGTYHNGDLNIRTRLTVQAYPDEQVWLSGTAAIGTWQRDGAAWRSASFTGCFRGKDNGVRPEDVDPEVPQAALTEMVFRDGTGLRQVASRAALRPGTFYVDCAARVLYVADDPAGHRTEASVRANGITVGGQRAAGTVIRGLGLSGYANTGLTSYSPRVTLERNVAVANAISGGWLHGAEAVVRGNVFAYNGRSGARGGEMDGSLVEGNLFLANNTEGFRRNWSAAGIKVINTDLLTARANRFEGNYGQGLWLDVSMTNAQVIGNVAAHNAGIGLFYELGDRGTFAGNVAYGNAAGIMLADSSRTRVYNNTLVGDKTAIIVKDSNRRNIEPAEVAAGVTWIASANEIRNNLSVLAEGKPLTASNCSTNPRARMVNTLDYNGYLRAGRRGLTTWDDNASRCRVNYADVAAFRAGTGHERHGVEFATVNGLFADLAGHDYRLASTSPAKGRGGPIPADIAAALGLPAAGPVDLGAPAIKAPSAPSAPSAKPTPSITAAPIAPSPTSGTEAPTASPATRSVTGSSSGSPSVFPPPGLGQLPLPPGAAPPATQGAVLVADSAPRLPDTGASPLPVSAAGLILIVLGTATVLYGRGRIVALRAPEHRRI